MMPNQKYSVLDQKYKTMITLMEKASRINPIFNAIVVAADQALILNNIEEADTLRIKAKLLIETANKLSLRMLEYQAKVKSRSSNPEYAYDYEKEFNAISDGYDQLLDEYIGYGPIFQKTVQQLQREQQAHRMQEEFVKVQQAEIQSILESISGAQQYLKLFLSRNGGSVPIYNDAVNNVTVLDGLMKDIQGIFNLNINQSRNDTYNTSYDRAYSIRSALTDKIIELQKLERQYQMEHSKQSNLNSQPAFGTPGGGAATAANDQSDKAPQTSERERESSVAGDDGYEADDDGSPAIKTSKSNISIDNETNQIIQEAKRLVEVAQGMDFGDINYDADELIDIIEEQIKAIQKPDITYLIQARECLKEDCNALQQLITKNPNNDDIFSFSDDETASQTSTGSYKSTSTMMVKSASTGNHGGYSDVIVPFDVYKNGGINEDIAADIEDVGHHIHAVLATNEDGNEYAVATYTKANVNTMEQRRDLAKATIAAALQNGAEQPLTIAYGSRQNMIEAFKVCEQSEIEYVKPVQGEKHYDVHQQAMNELKGLGLNDKAEYAISNVTVKDPATNIAACREYTKKISSNANKGIRGDMTRSVNNINQPSNCGPSPRNR